MNSVISIKPFDDKGYVLMINLKKALELGLNKKCMCYVGFGTQKCYVNIRMSDDIQENDIYLSQKLVDYLYLPDYPDFEIRINGNEVMIGPYVGILYHNYHEKITKENLRSALKFIYQYSSLHGAVAIFALDKADRSKRLIEGYCYNPKLKDWASGTFPYPLSIYLWVAMDHSWKNHFLSVIGDTMFNNYYLDKYEMYEWLSTNPYMAKHLPYTVLYKSSQDVFDMLKSYTKVYVKPVSGFKGYGVVKISLEDGKASISYRENGSNIDMHIDDPNESKEYMEKLFTSSDGSSNYIIQQPIDLISYENRVIDFRAVMQKDDSGSFVCKAVIGRIGAADSVVSNISNGGKAMPAADLLRKALNLSDTETIAIEKEISSFGLQVCNTLADRGINYGNLGLDIGVDKKGCLWLIEINSRRPHPTVSLSVKETKMRISNPLFYAKYLAGFGSK